jgi:predicted enzyme related to lactoylglutathione lyase
MLAFSGPCSTRPGERGRADDVVAGVLRKVHWRFGMRPAIGGTRALLRVALLGCSGMSKVSICVDVADLDAATAFYCEALGCSLEKRQPSHNTLLAGGVTLHLSLKEAGSDPTGAGSSTRSYERHWTPVHLDFDVADVDATVNLVTRFGGTVEAVKRGDWGTAAFCADPFGNGLCLLAIRR